MNGSSTAGDTFLVIFILGLGLAALLVYLLPTLIAFFRSHRNRWVILVINVVFGATLLGWLFSLIWALNKIDAPVKGGRKWDPQPGDPTL